MRDTLELFPEFREEATSVTTCQGELKPHFHRKDGKSFGLGKGGGIYGRQVILVEEFLPSVGWNYTVPEERRSVITTSRNYPRIHVGMLKQSS